MGSYFPKINFGLNLSVQYKDFDLSALLQGAADVKSAPVAEIRYAFYNGGKVTEQHLDRWTPENPNATYPRLSMSDSKNRVTSSFWMQDASYAKLEKPASRLQPAQTADIQIRNQPFESVLQYRQSLYDFRLRRCRPRSHQRQLLSIDPKLFLRSECNILNTDNYETKI